MDYAQENKNSEPGLQWLQAHVALKPEDQYQMHQVRAWFIVLYADLWFSSAKWPHGRSLLSLLNLSVFFISFALLMNLVSQTTR